MKQVPYTTRTGIKIGSNYQKDCRPEITEDMEIIQSVLLGNYKSLRRKNMEVFAYLTVLTLAIWAAAVFAK